MVSVPTASVLSVDRSQPPVAADDADDAEAPAVAVAVAVAPDAVADSVAEWLGLGLGEEPPPEHAATIAASRSRYGSLRERRVRVHLAGGRRCLGTVAAGCPNVSRGRAQTPTGSRTSTTVVRPGLTPTAVPRIDDQQPSRVRPDVFDIVRNGRIPGQVVAGPELDHMLALGQTPATG